MNRQQQQPAMAQLSESPPLTESVQESPSLPGITDSRPHQMGNPPSGCFHQNNTPRQYSEKIPANLSSRKPIPRKTPPMQANTAIASILKKSDNNINITLILFHYPAIRNGVSCNSRPFPAENGRPTSFQAPASLRLPHWTAPQMRPWNGFPARHSPWHN